MLAHQNRIKKMAEREAAIMVSPTAIVVYPAVCNALSSQG